MSGQQGPLRSAFLVKSDLTVEGYIATNAAIAIMVDIPRITIYLTSFSLVSTEKNVVLIVAATAAGFLGALLGNLWLKKVTMRVIQLIVDIMLLAIGATLGSGLL